MTTSPPRSNQTTATNPASTLLFPGRRAGQPIHPGSLRLRLQRLGIPNLNGRTRAIRDLLQQAPPAVIASMLGYHSNTAETLAAQTGATWQRYSATRSATLKGKAITMPSSTTPDPGRT